MADETSSGSAGTGETGGATGGYEGQSGGSGGPQGESTLTDPVGAGTEAGPGGGSGGGSGGNGGAGGGASGGEGGAVGATPAGAAGATTLTNIPVTVLGTFNYWGAMAVVGKQWYSQGNTNTNGYWFLVLDLYSLQAVANVYSSSNSQVPAQVQQYAGNPRYFLIVASVAVRNDNLPTGTLYNFLQTTGSGPKLARAEQIGTQLGTGYVSGCSYILAATMNTTDAPGFEELSSTNFTIMTFQFMPVTIGGQLVYIPVNTGAL